jgi:hypothetical protein
LFALYFKRTILQEASIMNNTKTMQHVVDNAPEAQTSLQWNQLGVDLFRSQHYERAVAAFTRAICVAKQETLAHSAQNACSMGRESRDHGVITGRAMNLRLQSLREPIALNVLHLNFLTDKSDEQFIFISSVLVMNLAIAQHSWVALRCQEFRDSRNNNDTDDEPPPSTNPSEWYAILRLYECASALLDGFLEKAQEIFEKSNPNWNVSVMLHRSLKLQVTHNMAEVLEQFDGMKARQFYCQLFSYVSSMSLASKDNTVPSDTSTNLPILLPGFPLEDMMNSIVRGLKILSAAITAPGA